MASEIPATIQLAGPFMRAEHGFAACLEHRDHEIRTHDGEVVIMCLGMLHGTYDELCAQTDYVLARAQSHGTSICSIIDASHPSFRFPDAMLRKLFKHLRKHEHCIRRIIFVGMPRIVRLGFKLTMPFLGETLRQRISILSKPELDTVLAPQDRPTALDGTWHFSIEEYIAWRADVEQVKVDASVRAFDASELANSSVALAGALRESGVSLEDVIFRCDGEKRGNGGWGSTRWKRKHFVFMPSMLVYGEGSDCADRTAISLRGSRLERTDSEVKLTTPERSYLFRFESSALELQFEEAYAKAVDGNQALQPSIVTGLEGKMGSLLTNGHPLHLEAVVG